MFSWGAKRQIIFTSIAVLFLSIVISIPVYFKFIKHTPTCFDNILNQDEKGVDCGGVCNKICPDEARPIVIHFERIFKSLDGVYSVLAMVENVNRNVYAKNVPYSFRIYDEEGVLLEEKSGEILIPPSRTFPIFEYAIYTGERIPKSTTLTLPSNINWVKGKFVEPNVRLSQQTYEVVDGRTIVRARLNNSEVYPIYDLTSVVLIYDKNDNLVRSSQTVVDKLEAQSQKDISFTWNEVFDFEIGRIDISPTLIPRDLK